MLIVVLSGARELPTDESRLESWIQQTVKSIRRDEREPVILIEGGADGVDSLGQSIAEQDPFTDSMTVHALWRLYGKQAGPRRNALMLSIAVAMANTREDTRGCLIAIPGPTSRGTWQAAETALRKGLSVYLLEDFADPARLAKFKEFQANRNK